MKMIDFSFYKNRKVLVTGHTGFKGSYLIKMLQMFGAEVYGYALEPATDPSLFRILNLEEEMKERSIIGDIRDFKKLSEVFEKAQPEIVFHLAAQPIVRTSYEMPRETYETNVMGTVNVLECVRHTKSVRSFLNVTTDKVYENLETDVAYKETDRLNGYDPYSNSKSCSELVTDSYKKSFFNGLDVAVSTMRSGNVLGGGDYSKDRIVPDAVRAAAKGMELIVRNPQSTRPFQHVFETLSAYLMLGMEQYANFHLAGSYNIGPDDNDIRTTENIANLFMKFWGDGFSWKHLKTEGPHEAKLLKLDSGKLRETFSWKPTWDLERTIQEIVRFEKAEDKKKMAEEQIRTFVRESGFYKM